MKKWNYKALSLLCGGLMMVAFAGYALAGSPTIEAGKGQSIQDVAGTEPAGVQETPAEESAAADNTPAATDPTGEGAPDLADQFLCPIWGPVLSVGEHSITIDNRSGISYTGEMVLNIDPEATRVLDAVNGYPVALTDIREGETIYAYIGPAMTLSLPPMTTAETVICQIPQDFKVPSFLTVTSMEQQTDQSYVLKAAGNSVFQVPADCQILPYLTRNIVRLTDVEQGSQCLVWSDSQGNAQKIVLFPRES